MALTTAPKASQKRKADSISSDSDHDVSPPANKKTSSAKSTSKKSPTYTTAELSALSHADLLAHTISLQTQLSAKLLTPSTKDLTPSEIAKKVENLGTLMTRQIKKAMTWKPSCKTGSAPFSQDFVVQSEQVLKALFKPVIKEGAKSWKMKKFSVDDFEEVVGSEIQASVRYGYLVLTSDVTVRWDAENGTMKCSGKYGKAGTGLAAMKMAMAKADDEV